MKSRILRNSWLHGFLALLGGLVLFSACPGVTEYETEYVTNDGPALALNSATGNWEDVDVVSGASLFRLDARTFVYADNGGSTLKKVDVLRPTVALASVEIGYPAATILGNVKSGYTAVVAGTIPSGTVRGVRLKVYDKNLKTLMDAPYGDQEDGEGKDFGTLYSEVMGSALAVGDKYAVIIWTDKTDTWRTAPSGGGGGGGGGSSTPGTATATYVGIYEIATGKSGHFKMTTQGDDVIGTAGGVDYYATITPDNVLAQSGIGSPASLATRGDYVLVGSSVGTAAFRIDADFALTNVTPETITDSIAGQNDKNLSHWMVDNGDYAMDCGRYAVKVWKWNGASAPTESIIDGLGADAQSNRSYVRQVCYDQDDPSKAYVLVKNSNTVTGSTGTTADKPNGFYSLNLAAGTKEYLFMPVFTNEDDDTTYAVSPWGCEHFMKGNDEWFVVVGATVEAFKNPPTQAADASNITITPDWHLEMSESVHIAKAFNADGRYFLAVKEGINEDFPVEGALVLHEITD